MCRGICVFHQGSIAIANLSLYTPPRHIGFRFENDNANDDNGNSSSNDDDDDDEEDDATSLVPIYESPISIRL